jgi:transposase
MTVEELVPDGLWAEIAPLLPAPPPRPQGGRRRVPYRNVVAGIVYVLRTGVPWRYVPAGELGCGSGVTCWRRLVEWQQAGVWEQLHQRLLERVNAAGGLDWSTAILDSTSVRAKRGGSWSAPIPPIAASRAPSTT